MSSKRDGNGAVNGDAVTPTNGNGTNGTNGHDRADRPRPPVAPPSFGSRIGTAGVPGEKSEDFRGSTARLLSAMGPERKWAAFVLACAVASVSLSVTGPHP